MNTGDRRSREDARKPRAGPAFGAGGGPTRLARRAGTLSGFVIEEDRVVLRVLSGPHTVEVWVTRTAQTRALTPDHIVDLDAGAELRVGDEVVCVGGLRPESSLEREIFDATAAGCVRIGTGSAGR